MNETEKKIYFQQRLLSYISKRTVIIIIIVITPSFIELSRFVAKSILSPKQSIGMPHNGHLYKSKRCRYLKWNENRIRISFKYSHIDYLYRYSIDYYNIAILKFYLHIFDKSECTKQIFNHIVTDKIYFKGRKRHVGPYVI